MKKKKVDGGEENEELRKWKSAGMGKIKTEPEESR